MSKSSLIIDTPEHCYLCTCYTEDEGDGYCLGITAKRVPTEGKPSWCPLKPYKKEDAIPIEWILKWACEFIDPNSEGYKMAMELVHDWRKENENRDTESTK